MATYDRVTYEVEPSDERNRLTVAFRPILAIPHLLLVRGPGIGIGFGSDRTGVLGLVAGVAAVINWFSIIFTRKSIEGLTNLQIYYLRWRANALAYEALLRDEYPPFGEGDYPSVHAAFSSAERARNRVSVGFRLVLAIPHLVVLVFLLLAWFVTAVMGWFAVLLTGEYPAGLWRFGTQVMHQVLRVESYLLLIHDDFPSFGLAASTTSPEAAPGQSVLRPMN